MSKDTYICTITMLTDELNSLNMPTVLRNVMCSVANMIIDGLETVVSDTANLSGDIKLRCTEEYAQNIISKEMFSVSLKKVKE